MCGEALKIDQKQRVSRTVELSAEEACIQKGSSVILMVNQQSPFVAREVLSSFMGGFTGN